MTGARIFIRLSTSHDEVRVPAAAVGAEVWSIVSIAIVLAGVTSEAVGAGVRSTVSIVSVGVTADAFGANFGAKASTAKVRAGVGAASVRTVVGSTVSSGLDVEVNPKNQRVRSTVSSEVGTRVSAGVSARVRTRVVAGVRSGAGVSLHLAPE